MQSSNNPSTRSTRSSNRLPPDTNPHQTVQETSLRHTETLSTATAGTYLEDEEVPRPNSPLRRRVDTPPLRIPSPHDLSSDRPLTADLRFNMSVEEYQQHLRCLTDQEVANALANLETEFIPILHSSRLTWYRSHHWIENHPRL